MFLYLNIGSIQQYILLGKNKTVIRDKTYVQLIPL